MPVNIDVTDTGKGISKQNINRVFNPGFTTKNVDGVWGLACQSELLISITKEKFL